jgi:PhnB protein
MSIQFNSFIMMNGNAKEAIQFYEKSLEAKVLFIQTVGEGPQNPDFPITTEEKARIAHSVLKVGDSEIMVSDNPPGLHIQSGNQVTICISTSDMEKTKQFYDELLEGGQVITALEETYFSPAYGMVKDKFGVTFQVFTKRPR